MQRRLSSAKVRSGNHNLRWLDRVFQGQYFPRLSTNCVAINKDLEKLPSQLYMKMRIVMIRVTMISELPSKRIDALPFLLEAAFFGTGNRSSKIVHGSFYFQ